LGDIVQSLGIKGKDKYESHRLYLEKIPRAIAAHACVLWVFDEDYVKFISKIIHSSKMSNLFEKCKKKGQIIYKDGFSATYERLCSIYLIYKDIDILENFNLVQHNSDIISKYKNIREFYNYHYTVIPDDHIFKLLPILLDEGPDSYKLALRDYKNEPLEKFAYIPHSVQRGWNANSALIRKIKANDRKTLNKLNNGKEVLEWMNSDYLTGPDIYLRKVLHVLYSLDNPIFDMSSVLIYTSKLDDRLILIRNSEGVKKSDDRWALKILENGIEVYKKDEKRQRIGSYPLYRFYKYSNVFK